MRRTIILAFILAALLPGAAFAQIQLLGAGGPMSSRNIVASPVVVTQGGTATDGTGTSFNSTTISLTVSGSNTLAIACAHAELDNGSSTYNWTFTYNSVTGRPLFETDGYHGGAGNKLLKCAYWVGPASGAHSLVVVYGVRGTPDAGAQELAVGGVVLSGVAQVLYPFRGTQKDISASTRTSETETVTSAVGDLILHVVASSEVAAGTLGTGETSIQYVNDGDTDASLLFTKKAGAATSTVVATTGWANNFPIEGLAMSIMPAGTAEDHVLYSTTFAGANADPISESGAWTAPAGATVGAVKLASHKAAGSGAIEDVAQIQAPSFASNAGQRAKITVDNTGFVRVWVRSGNTGGYMLTFADANDIQIFYVPNNGTVFDYTHQLGATVALSYNAIAGDTLELEVIGTTITAYFNGWFLATRTDANIASGAPGLGSFGAINITAAFEASSTPVRN